MNTKRYFDKRERLSDLIVARDDDPVLVVCPKCNSKALIFPNPEHRCVCTKCSFIKTKPDKKLKYGFYMDIMIDTYFGFELWLQIRCCGTSLYAFTQRHLKFIENYIEADLRERKQDEFGWRNSSLASRLPQWIKSSKNREQLIKSIKKLKQKL